MGELQTPLHFDLSSSTGDYGVPYMLKLNFGRRTTGDYACSLHVDVKFGPESYGGLRGPLYIEFKL